MYRFLIGLRAAAVSFATIALGTTAAAATTRSAYGFAEGDSGL